MVHSHELFTTTKLSGINKLKVFMVHMFQTDRAEWRPRLNWKLMCNFGNHNVTEKLCNQRKEISCPSCELAVCTSWIHITAVGFSFTGLFFDVRIPLLLNRGCLLRLQRWFTEDVLRCNELRFFISVWLLYCHLTLGWEHAEKSQMPGTEGSSGRSATALCAWWLPLCDGFVVPPGTL